MIEQDELSGTKWSGKKGEVKNDPVLKGSALSHSAAGLEKNCQKTGSVCAKTEDKAQKGGAVGPRHFVRQCVAELHEVIKHGQRTKSSTNIH